MESILRSEEMDKINEIYNKAYNPLSNIIYFPIRHHSPACSYHLKKVIENYKPEIILIEGPTDANLITKYIAHNDTKAPICIYYSYSDMKKLVSGDGEKFRCYYPFLDYSPELVALREANNQNIPALFIDLPYPEILINSEEDRGLRKSNEKNSYNDDYLFQKSRFIHSLCEAEGCKSFNELWEKLFEINGFYIESGEFIKNMIAFCYLSRCYESDDMLISEGCIAREIYMAKQIKEYGRSYEKVLVVTGGFHTSGLIELSGENEDIQLHNIDKDSIGAYPMVYSFEESDQLNGYASGMPHPGFYQQVWDNYNNNVDKVYEKAVLHFIVRCGNRVRKSDGGGSISTADEVEAFNMARGLSNIRGKAQCGVYELFDCIRSAFIKGDLNIATDKPLLELTKLITGKKIGELCSETEVPPIVMDFRELCSKYKLKINNTIEQEIILDIYKSTRHHEISWFLHRMKFIETGFCLNIKGPDFINRKNISLIRETWKYKWSVKVESSLIENSVYGGTLREASETLLLKGLAVNQNDSGKISLRLIEAFMMGLYDILARALSNMEENIMKDGSFYSVAQCTYNLYFIHNGSSLLSNEKNLGVRSLLLQSYNKAISLIPGLYCIPVDAEDDIIAKLKDIYHICHETEVNLDGSILSEALLTLIDKKEINSTLEGAALGLLYGLNEVDNEFILKRSEGYLYGTGDKFLKSASFLKGLFSTARDIVLNDNKLILGINNVVKNLDEVDFLRLLPELRLSFGFFTPSEIDEIGKMVAQNFDLKEKKLLETEAVDPEDIKIGMELDSFGKETLKEWGLL